MPDHAGHGKVSWNKEQVEARQLVSQSLDTSPCREPFNPTRQICGLHKGAYLYLFIYIYIYTYTYIILCI